MISTAVPIAAVLFLCFWVHILTVTLPDQIFQETNPSFVDLNNKLELLSHGIKSTDTGTLLELQTAKTAVEAFESKYIPENECEVGEKENCTEDIDMAPLKGFIQRACFTGLKKDVNYCVKVRTVVNGKTICQVSEDIAKDQENLPTETQEAPI